MCINMLYSPYQKEGWTPQCGHTYQVHFFCLLHAVRASQKIRLKIFYHLHSSLKGRRSWPHSSAAKSKMEKLGSLTIFLIIGRMFWHPNGVQSHFYVPLQTNA